MDKGFVNTILIIVVTLFLLGGASWYVFLKDKDKDKDKNKEEGEGDKDKDKDQKPLPEGEDKAPGGKEESEKPPKPPKQEKVFEVTNVDHSFRTVGIRVKGVYDFVINAQDVLGTLLAGQRTFEGERILVTWKAQGQTLIIESRMEGQVVQRQKIDFTEAVRVPAILTSNNPLPFPVSVFV